AAELLCPVFKNGAVGEVVVEGRDGDVALEELLHVGAGVGDAEVEAVRRGPVVRVARGRDASFVLVVVPVGVHGADADGGHRRLFFGDGDVDAEAGVGGRRAVGEDGLDGTPRVAG